MKAIKSISYNQAEIIKDILTLHVPSHRIDLDATYSTGNFYRNTGVEQPKFKYDINPQSNDVEKCDCRKLPLTNRSLECIMFDPPFLATTGKSLLKSQGNIINKRFGVYPDEKSLHQFYIDSLIEFHRVLKDNGILIFKCQDKISSGTQYMSHCFVYNEAIKAGFYPKDLFILLSKTRLIANWQLKSQKNARKYHCYFWVFQKSNKIVNYVDKERINK